MAKTRTDVHRPSALVTEDYEYVWSYDSEAPGCLIHVAGTDWWRDICLNRAEIHEQGRCDHCGAHLRYIAILKHTPSGKYLEVGETCLENRFERATTDFQHLRKQAQLDREQQRIKKAVEEYRSEHAAPWGELDQSANPFIIDVLAKLRRYGNLSDRQLEAICQAYERDNAPEPEPEKTTDVPEGTQTIEGTVISVKLKEHQFGAVLKCLVKVETEAGSYKVWGSVPSSLSSAIVDRSKCIRRANGSIDPPTYRTGIVVRFVATVQRSADDNSFGFFKRPRKAEVLQSAS